MVISEGGSGFSLFSGIAIKRSLGSGPDSVFAGMLIVCQKKIKKLVLVGRCFMMEVSMIDFDVDPFVSRNDAYFDREHGPTYVLGGRKAETI